MLLKIISIINIILLNIVCEELPPGNLTDLNLCKVSHLGMEFTGRIGRTESLVRCQSWTSSIPHKIRDYILDQHFPEGSRKLAKNYCRNPTRDIMGPWCYTMAEDLQFETCAIPLCKFSQCKVTGPGMEYAGNHNKGRSSRNCLKWNKNRNKVKENGTYASKPKFNKILFPEENLSDAKKFCRNPSGDIGGPWCFVEDEDTGEVEKEYCDIPFCDDPECLVFTKNFDTYIHYTDFNNTLANLTFGVKLWDPDLYLQASARIVLSVVPLPLTGLEIEKSGIGLEIFIANNYSTLRFGNKDTPEYESTIGILKSTSFTSFSLSWHQGFMSFGLEGISKPIFLAEYKTKNNLLGFKMNKFNYYSVQGTNILWSFPFCKDDFECDAHTTTGKEFQQFWPLREKGAGYDLYVYVRAHHSACILFVLSPTMEYPYVKLTLSDKNNYTRITVKDYFEAPERDLIDIQVANVLDYWTWREFSIGFFTNIMSIYVEKPLGLQSIAEVTDEIFRNVRWFSVSSDNTVAHWSFYCVPPQTANPPQAFLPECALNNQEKNYQGTQDVTDTGLPCIPWSASSLIGHEVTFPNSTTLEMWNYCRDPSEKNTGTYCYTMSLSPEKEVSRTFCRIRKCKSEQCRMAGTGNDYSGTLKKTRSNRICTKWVPKTFGSVLKNIFKGNGSDNAKSLVVRKSADLEPKDFRQIWNDTLFPEGSASKAESFCRNPSRNMAGSWCYTSDPYVPEDACNIRDCDKPEECIVIVSTTKRTRKVFILPQWKETGHQGGLRFALKEWNPDDLDGVSIRITPNYETTDSMTLQIAADYNERIKLYRNDQIIEEKTMPHLIGAGKWTDMWLQIRRGEIMLGLEGVPTSLFEWISPNKNEEFDPIFLSYTSILGKPMGFFFKCDECHTENATLYNFQHVFPIGIWSEEQPLFKNLTLIVRGTGYIIIKLMRLLEYHTFYNLVIDTDENQLILIRVDNYYKRSLLQMTRVPDLMETKSWTKYELFFTESSFKVRKDNKIILSHNSRKPLLMYWFSIAPQIGWVTWAANCQPLDLDGPPRDGGWSRWSPWACSAPCGGGEGFRTRTCSNPRPNIFGRLCQGSPTSTGKCNEFPCGDINPETLEKIRDHLQHKSFSHIVPEGSSQLLLNDKEILTLVDKDSPKAYYEWTLNGIFITAEQDRVVFEKGNIQIKHVLPRDAGLYVCMLFRINKQRVVIRVHSLAVISKELDYDTRATRALHLTCNSVILGYIYSYLSLKLYLNDTVYIDHGTTTLAAVNTYFFDSLKREHTGDWKCVVEQKDLQLTWVTNYLRINVKKAPNIFTNLMEDELTRPIFGWMKSETAVLVAVLLIVAIVIFFVIIFLVIYKRFCTLKTPRYKRNRIK